MVAIYFTVAWNENQLKFARNWERYFPVVKIKKHSSYRLARDNKPRKGA
jgi:hypothetical protein